jgi:hypothetical protein
MAGLNLKLIIVGVVFAAAGATLVLPVNPDANAKSEQELASLVPTSFGEYEYIPGDEKTPKGLTYKMDKRTYDLLQPHGIVSRVYKDKQNLMYDAVIIVGTNKRSFHDPRVCFGSQGWQITGERNKEIDTKHFGKISVAVVSIRKDSDKREAVYFYHSPSGFVSTTRGLALDMMMMPFKGKSDLTSVFYRFMPSGEANLTEEQLFKFISEYVDASHEFSNGYF